jgi:hypothetical protein
VAQDQASVREGSVWAGQDPARRVEAPVPAVLVEDCREGKEHLEFEKASTSCLFGTAIGPGCIRMDRSLYACRSKTANAAMSDPGPDVDNYFI